MSRPTVRSFLIVVLLLTLLVSLAPFAQAAPEYVSAVTITSPTTAAKAYVHAGGPLQVAYTVTTAGATGPAQANFYLGSTLVNTVAINLPNLGFNDLTQALTIPGGTAEATYDVMVEVRQDIVQANWVQAVQNSAVVVDNTPPTITPTTLTVPNGGETWQLGSAKAITWTAADITDTNLGATPIALYLSMDGGATWPTLIAPGIANSGSYTWTVGGGFGTQMRVKLVATDLAGNAVLDISNANFTIGGTDATPPVPTLTAPATGTFISGTAYQVKGTAVDGGSGIASVLFEYSMNGVTWFSIGPGVLTGVLPNEYAALWNTTASTPPLPDGTVVQVRETATNGVGASGTSVNTNITIDNSAPTAELTAPLAGAFVTGAAVPVTASASDPLSGILNVTLWYSPTLGTWTPIDGALTAPPYSLNWNTTGVTDGPAKLKAIATNRAGKTTQSVAVSVTVDNTKPALTPPVLLIPNNGEAWKMGLLHMITWNAGAITDVNLLTNPITLLLSSDGGASFPMTIAAGQPNSGSFPWTPAVLVPGVNYLVKLVVTDQAGNTAEDRGHNLPFALWDSDSTAPLVTLTAPIINSFVTGAAVPVTASASDPESGILNVTLWYSPTLGTWTPIDGALTAPPYSLNWNTTVVTDGPAKLKARATNGNNLTTESAIVNVTIDNSLPAVNLVQPANGTNIFGPASPLLATASDAQSGVTEVKFWYAGYVPNSCGASWTLIGAGAPTVKPGEYAGSWDTTALADGEYCVKVVAKNGVALTHEHSHRVTVQNTYTIALVPGWNLISLPVIPFSTDIEVALTDLKAHGSVKQVTTFVWQGGILMQKIWSLGPKTLTTMVDGQAYWIEMTASDNLVVHGAPNLPPPAVPPAYGVKTGWNMLGFKSTGDSSPADYLGPAVTPTVSAMYGYNTGTGLFFTPSRLSPGRGYWLAVNADGTVYP